ncbi:DDE-type integrase/transposase/recombinase [Candidatus Vondammii sp. HM_W22]|uniref:DDE-type integrase/transposase/recombinase n=1 Tax=Candidatus Vondammii sp. HM_W22 TaxID=2687299 RepID=UPI002E7B86D5|nr:DDE-type integrase/transposase/recombinase [Candidatus Vondammii sp. HM_W22]
MYFSIVMDLHTRKIVGIEVSKKRNVDMMLNTIKKALTAHSEHCSKVFHSDRGIRYANHMVGDWLKDLGVEQSMSGKGNGYNNAHMESFFHTYKSEFYYTEPFRSFLEFKRKTTKYVRF